MAKRYRITIKNGKPNAIIEHHPTSMTVAYVRASERVLEEMIAPIGDIPLINRLYYQARLKVAHSSRLDIDATIADGKYSVNVQRIRYNSRDENKRSCDNLTDHLHR